MSYANEETKILSDELQLFAEKEYSSEIITAMLSENSSPHMSIAIDSMNLFDSNIAFSHYLFKNPRNALKILDDAFRKVAFNISKTHDLKSEMIYKENLHVRLFSLPSLPEVYRSNLPDCSNVGQFICINGTVIKASTTKLLQYKKLWHCGKCKYKFIVESEVEKCYICEKPMMCSNSEECNGRNFTLLDSDINIEWCKDYQELRLQEHVYNLNVGIVPKSMCVILEDDLVEMCHAGNDVIVSGIVIQRWKPLFKGCLIDLELVLLAHNIEVQNKMSPGVVSKTMAHEIGQFWQNHVSDPLKGRDIILSSICPQVFGLYIVKLAVALVLAGGVQKKSSNSRIRGDSHLLLIGDPGTAKSQFLKFASKISYRSVITSGIGTSNAGLTVSAVKESGKWQLEAGALVLADGGICCIDEFSCIKEQDKTCIHEAMEQQTISVAKAGLVCSLNTRCSIVAATNPKGKYDKNMSISENTALGTPLLSRFDIILVLLDTYDERWDEMVSSYILKGRNILSENNVELWSIDKMKSYFTLIRHISPKVTSDAENVLRTYYARQRSWQGRSTSRTTPRLLQSLIRLAEGHARLMFRDKVLVSDAIIAILLIESSMLGSSIIEDLSPLLTVFPSDPSSEYEYRSDTILKNLNLDLPIKENYETFYCEYNIEKILSDTFSVWNTKKEVYIFEKSQAQDVTNSVINNLQDSDSITDNFTSEIQAFDRSNNSSNITTLLPNNYNFSNECVPLSKIMTKTEVHQNRQNSISTSLGNTFESEIIQASTSNINILKDKSSKIMECSKNINSPASNNLFILQQILEEPDTPQDAIIELKDSYKSKDQIFALPDVNSISQIKMCEPAAHDLNKDVVENPFAEANCCAKSQFEYNNMSNLTELRSYKKGFKEKFVPQPKSLQISTLHNESKNITFIRNSLPQKHSLADNLKNFVLQRCQNASQQHSPFHHISNTEDETTSGDVNNSKNENCTLKNSNLNIENISQDKVEEDNHIEGRPKSKFLSRVHKNLTGFSKLPKKDNFETKINHSIQSNEQLQQTSTVKKNLKQFLFVKRPKLNYD